jgi:hypothetical protein
LHDSDGKPVSTFPDHAPAFDAKIGAAIHQRAKHVGARWIAEECRDLRDFGSTIHAFSYADKAAAPRTNTTAETVAIARDWLHRGT